MRVHYNVQPDPVSYSAAPDGTWVFFRENITDDGQTETGEPQYSADEYCIKLGCSETVARNRITANMTVWLAKAKAQPTPEPTAAERIAALEAENSMLTECVLEMSELLYA